MNNLKGLLKKEQVAGGVWLPGPREMPVRLTVCCYMTSDYDKTHSVGSQNPGSAAARLTTPGSLRLPQCDDSDADHG